MKKSMSADELLKKFEECEYETPVEIDMIRSVNIISQYLSTGRRELIADKHFVCHLITSIIIGVDSSMNLHEPPQIERNGKMLIYRYEHDVDHGHGRIYTIEITLNTYDGFVYAEYTPQGDYFLDWNEN